MVTIILNLLVIIWLQPTMQINKPHYTYFQRGNPADVRSQRHGGFALMGGAGDVDETFRWMAERGGGGDFLVLRGSGSDGYQDYIHELTGCDSVETLVIREREAASDPFVLERVAQADAIFLAGGDQWNYVGKWKDTPLMGALNQAILDGVPLGGTSAGLAVLGEHVFTAEKDTITSDQALKNPYHQAVTIERDFLQAPPLANLITDSHFSERDRMGRLVTFMSRLQQDRGLEQVRGVGVDESTVVLVEPEGEGRVVGQGAAHFVQALEAPQECRPGAPLSHRFEVHSVGHGQTFDLNSWRSPEVQPRALEVDSGRLKP